MNVLISLDHRFYGTNDGVYDDTTYGRDFFEPYVKAFGHVTILARVRYVSSLPTTYKRVDNSDISFYALPDYSRKDFYYKFPRMLYSLYKVKLSDFDAVIYRKPCRVGRWLSLFNNPSKYPHLIELIGDSFDIARLVPNKLLRIYSLFNAFWERKQIKSAPIVSYVTKSYLQNDFPASKTAFTYAWSDVKLEKSDYSYRRKEFPQELTFIYVASFTSYKCHCLLLEILSKIKQLGYSWKLILIGDGVLKEDILSKIKELHLTNDVLLTGNIQRSDIYSYLKKADVYISTSMTEGLPRAVLEAMSQSLPVVAFNVGGFSELIDESMLVNKDNVGEMIDLIQRIYKDHTLLEKAADYNYERSLLYNVDDMKKTRILSYEKLKDLAKN